MERYCGFSLSAIFRTDIWKGMEYLEANGGAYAVVDGPCGNRYIGLDGYLHGVSVGRQF